MFENTRKCFLYTLDGIFNAEVITNYNSRASTIKSEDGKYSIQVTNGTIDHKFDQETKPTFYAC